MESMKLILGLGNPGKEYADTRHNAGFIALDFLRGYFGLEPFKMSAKHRAEIAQGEVQGEKIILAKPQTYMNLSGEAAASIAAFYKIPAENIIVIHDEADLPWGAVRVRQGGSSAGHNGIKSLIASLGENFYRVRLGIKPEKPFPGSLEDYVLGRLSEDEKTQLDQVIEALPEKLNPLIQFTA